MELKKREIRTIECELAVREAAADAQESRTIYGTAIVFNRESEVLDDWGEKFREIILPEAVTMAWLNTQDVKMNLLHERELAIARANKGKGGLKLSVDGLGVHFEFEAPRCDLGDRALELIRTGVYSGCSFEFYPQDYEVDERGDEVIIKHRKFASLNALTIGMDPAYRQTTVNARELSHKEREAETKEATREGAGEPRGAAAKESERGTALESAGTAAREEGEGTKPEQKECGGDEPKQKECGGDEPKQKECGGEEPKQKECGGEEPKQKECGGEEPKRDTEHEDDEDETKMDDDDVEGREATQELLRRSATIKARIKMKSIYV